jgi:hypothetical protein
MIIMADEPIPSPHFSDATNAAIIASGRNPSSLSAVFEAALNKGGNIEAAADAEFRAVFGENAKRDSKGQPIEVGKGSNAQQTSQHVAACRSGRGEGDGGHRKF